MPGALAPCLMVQGSASGVGKSVIATAICQVLAQEGFRVSPFKAQNMSNNAAVTGDGGEIGRAQAAQAEAAGVAPSVLMNPVLLKPEADNRSQLVVLGRAIGSYTAQEYWARRPSIWPTITSSLRELRRTSDVVVIEGAGSPAELNLRGRDIANMRLARHARARVLLVGDIDRGGIFAQLLGTLDLLPPEERRLIVGLLVNRFRGYRRLFEGGVRILRRRSGLPVLGVLPYEPELDVPDEDSASLDRPRPRVASTLRAALIAYPRVANFDDLDPLRHAGVDVDIVRRPEALGWPDLIVLPGSKSTIDDLLWLRRSGLAAAVMRAAAGGVPVLGICAGYQMLGQSLEDPDGVEGPSRSTPGLSLLPVVTRFRSPKRTRQVHGTIAVGSALGPSGTPFRGYEIHSGVTRRSAGSPFALLTGGQVAAEEDGAVSPDGLVLGTSVHGLFADPHASRALVSSLAKRRGVAPPLAAPSVDAGAWFRSAVDIPELMTIFGLRSASRRRRRKGVPAAAAL
jgi:adenosylcobyric acid synthase